VSQRLRDNTFNSPARPDRVAGSSAADRLRAAVHVSQFSVSLVADLRYSSEVSAQVEATRPFTFAQQFHDKVQEEAAELRAEVASTANRNAVIRRHRAAKIREAKEFWREHPMPTAVDINRLLPDRGNNLRVALHAVKKPVLEEEQST
jgi:hypothetical protein